MPQSYDMPRSYTMLKDKDNIIWRNRRHLIKIGSNFVKTVNHNDMDNDIETEPKTRQSRPASEPGEVDETRDNATELRETSSYTTPPGRSISIIKTVKILIAKGGCYV